MIVLFSAELGAPVGKKCRILPLYLLPHRIPLRVLHCLAMLGQEDLRQHKIEHR